MLTLTKDDNIKKPEFLDVSGYNKFRSCPCKFCFSQILGLRERELSAPMTYGSALHCPASYLYAGDIEKACLGFRNYWKKEGLDKGIEENDQRNMYNGIRLLEYIYTTKIQTKRLPFTIINPPQNALQTNRRISSCEFAFCFDVDAKLPFAGRIDFVSRHRVTNKIWGGEIKTSSRFGQSFLHSWELNSQIIGYFTALQLLFPDEEIEGFFLEAYRTSKTNPEHLTIPIQPSNYEVDEFLDDFALACEELLTYYEAGKFPRRYCSCNPYPTQGIHGYPCQYTNLCKGQGPDSWRNFIPMFKVEYWSPFLEETQDKEIKKNEC